MFKRETDILNSLSERLTADKRILMIVVYGSRVRGDCRGDSDLDVLIVVDKKDRTIKDKILDIVYEYELLSDISFSLKILSVQEMEFNKRLGSPFLKSIEKEGIILYDSERRGEKISLKISP